MHSSKESMGSSEGQCVVNSTEDYFIIIVFAAFYLTLRSNSEHMKFALICVFGRV